MADTIDVDKLKNDAFDAIDALFGEDDNDSSVEEQHSVDIPIPSEPDEFAMLEEFSLALDWEYSDKEINRFNDYLDNIARKNSDKYNQALVKMLKSIISYLQKARNKAFPQTLSVMISVIDSLKKINAPGFDKNLIKPEVSSAYQKVVILKQKISDYNEELKKHGTKSEMTVVPDTAGFEPEPEPEKEEESVETIYSYELIDDEETPETEVQPDIFSEMVSSDDFSQPFTIEEEPSEPPESVFDFSGETDAVQETDGGLLDRLASLESKVARLETQNRELKRLILEKQPERELFAEENFNSEIDEPADTGFDADAFSSEDDMFSSIEDDPLAEEPLIVEVDEIAYDSMGDEITSDVFESPEKYEEEEDIENIALPSDDMDYAETDRKEDFIEYVRFFMIGQQVVALPNDYINNVYKLPSGIQKNIHSMTTLTLQELSSVFQKLHKNMKGSLQDTPANELNEISAAIKIIGTETLNYKYGVLCSCDDTHVIVPITDKHRTKLKLATSMAKAETGFSEYTVDIDGMGSIPLVIPC